MKTVVNTLPSGSYFKLEGSAYNQEFLLPTASVGVMLRFDTVVPAAAAASLSTEPHKINLPEGRFLLVGGIGFYAQGANVDLDLGAEFRIATAGLDWVLVKQESPGNVSGGQAFALSQYQSGPVGSAPQGPFFLSADADAATPPDGDIMLSLFVIPL